MQSRYYNPEWGRFINADGLVSTGQGLLAHNMYAYCNNNPVNMQDPTGKITLLAGLLISIVVVAIIAIIPPQNNTQSGSSIIQSIVDSIPSTSSSKTTTKTNTSSKTTTKTKVKTETQTKTQTKTKSSKEKIVFPANPLEFNPSGAIKVEYPGNSNGKIIKWFVNGISLFEWDEDWNVGSHYHITPNGRHEDIGMMHYWPLTPIPEPYATMFFK